jgi:enamine deaminase RidA (YjgF/YER057c/UK114 family)
MRAGCVAAPSAWSSTNARSGSVAWHVPCCSGRMPSMADDQIADRLDELGRALPASCPPRALFRPWRRSGALLILSGQVNEIDGHIVRTGLVGTDISIADAGRQAEICLLNLLFNLKDACGGRLDRVHSWMRLGGFVAASTGFADAPAVINAASKLLIDIYGSEIGAHARTAIAVAGLPGGACVEIDAMVEVTT